MFVEFDKNLILNFMFNKITFLLFNLIIFSTATSKAQTWNIVPSPSEPLSKIGFFTPTIGITATSPGAQGAWWPTAG